MKNSRSFFSLYFFVISVFIVFSWILDEVWKSYLEQDIESYTGYKAMLHAVADFAKQHPEDEWETIVIGAGDKYGMPLSLMPLRQLTNVPRKDYKALKKGNTYVYYNDDDVMLHHLVEGSETLITLGPAKMPTRPRIEALVRVALLVLLAIFILLGLKPISRDLDHLRKATERFGNGNFDEKAPQAISSMIAPMNRTFNMMAERIKRLIEAHKELTTAVAHELRTPLARSRFALQMLKSSKDPEKQNKYIEQINVDISELEELINEMLVYAEFENDRPELNYAAEHIYHLVERCVNGQPSTSKALHIENNVGNLNVDCDAYFVERAIGNYISNAIKYGKSKIKVSISQAGDDCLISVEDNGSGLSDSLKDIIFDPFSRGDNSRNKETGGFGLGLAIVKRIMQWHHGSALVKDSDLGGAAFMLKLPIRKR